MEFHSVFVECLSLIARFSIFSFEEKKFERSLRDSFVDGNQLSTRDRTVLFASNSRIGGEREKGKGQSSKLGETRFRTVTSTHSKLDCIVF